MNWVIQYKKQARLQIREGGHGKTGKIDGIIFGQSGVGGVVKEFKKNNSSWTNKEYFKNIKKFSKLNNKMDLLNVQTNGIMKMDDVIMVENKEK